MTSRFDIDNTGFRREDLLRFLADGGVHLANRSNENASLTAPVAKPVPLWANGRRGLRRLFLSEAARVLIGVDPLDSEWHGDDEWREFEGAKRVLQQAIEDGEIKSVDIDFERNGEEVFSASDLRNWALSHAYDWPIPELPTNVGPGPISSSAPSCGDGELLKRLQDSERQRNELQAEVDRLKAEGKRASDQSAALTEQAVQIGKLQADFASAQDEIRKLKDEIGQGKSLSTWQKLVIGMAVERYGYQPNVARSTTAADISAALGSARIEVTAETVRNCLRTAADLHLGSAGRR